MQLLDAPCCLLAFFLGNQLSTYESHNEQIATGRAWGFCKQPHAVSGLKINPL